MASVASSPTPNWASASRGGSSGTRPASKHSAGVGHGGAAVPEGRAVGRTSSTRTAPAPLGPIFEPGDVGRDREVRTERGEDALLVSGGGHVETVRAPDVVADEQLGQEPPSWFAGVMALDNGVAA